MMELTRFSAFRRTLSVFMTIVFVMSSVGRPYAQTAVNLPEPGKMMGLSSAAAPILLRGFTIDPRDPFSFEFLMDRGQAALTPDEKKTEYQKQVKYFLASLTIPEKDLWVNLSPYENDRIISDNFGLTAMGRDLLAQDYILKQITASLIHPDSALGKIFWDKVYKAAAEKYGTTNIPVDTFNKVWIMPDQAEVYANGLSVLLVKSHLKVMLDADRTANMRADTRSPQEEVSRQVMREVVLPILEKEVNEGANFAAVRQITSALILATWYKKQWQQHLLNPVYSDRSKVKGVDQDPANNAVIYQKYVEAFKQGVFNFIKEEVDVSSQETIPRKYFSGGYTTRDDAQKPLSERIMRLSTPPAAADFAQDDSVRVRFNIFHPFRSRPIASDVNIAAEFEKRGYWPLIEQDAAINDRKIDPGLRQAPLKVGAFFTDYFKKHLGVLVLKNYPALERLLENKQIDGDDAFDVIAKALKRKLAPLYRKLDKGAALTAIEEGRLETLSFQAVRFVQNVLMSSSLYGARMSSMADILQGLGWNDTSLSMMTVLLADIMGIRGVSLVSVGLDEVSVGFDEQGLRYPYFKGEDIYLKYGSQNVYHFVNMVWAGKECFILDQGWQSKPDGLLVVDFQEHLSAIGYYELKDGPIFSGLDVLRLKQYFLARKDVKDVEVEIDRTLTEELFNANPDRYALMRGKLNYDMERAINSNALLLMQSSFSLAWEVLPARLEPDYWTKRPKLADIIRSYDEFRGDLKDLLRSADDLSSMAIGSKDPKASRHAAQRYRVAAQMAALELELWDKHKQNKEFTNDTIRSYGPWERERDYLDKTIKDSQASANILDNNAVLYTAQDEINNFRNGAEGMKQTHPKAAMDILTAINKKIDLLVTSFEVARKEKRYEIETPFEDFMGQFYKDKKAVAEEQQKILDAMLDHYNATHEKLWGKTLDKDNAEKFKGSVDHGQANKSLGGIDLDPSKFDIKAQGNMDALFTEVPAADAVQIEGLEPQILSITPGDGFLKRFSIK